MENAQTNCNFIKNGSVDILECYFEKFFQVINLTGDYREIANKRKDRIIELLSKKFSIIDAFGSGSIPKYTALKDHADLDVMVVLNFEKHIENKKPLEVLESIRDTLAEYRTNVRKNGQAVTLYYDTWPNVDIVPVSQFMDAGGNISHYNIPDIHTGTWIRSNPKTHAFRIEQKSSECGSNFRRIIKMIKLWNLYHSNYLQSYHIEVLALNVLEGKLDHTPLNIYHFFKRSRLLLQSPHFYAGAYVDYYLNDKNRAEVLRRFDTAIEKCESAFRYKFNNDYRNVFRVWQQVFGEKFSEYEQFDNKN